MLWAGKRMSVSYYKKMDSSSIGGRTAILDHFASSFFTNMFRNLCDGPIELVEHTLRDTGVTDGGVTQISTTDHTGGTVAPSAETVPMPVAMVFSLRSGMIGRSRRGRMYIPAIGAAAFNEGNGQWNDATVSADQETAATWLSDSNSAVSGSVSSST